MKVYRSLDFESAPARVEPTVAGEYIVHDEDFEDINDLVQRAIRTKTKLPDFSSEDVSYDEEDVFVEDIKNEYEHTQKDNSLSENTAQEPSDEVPSSERSVAAGTLPDGEKDVSQTP